VKVRIIGSNLPGTHCGDHVGVRVGMQRGASVVEVVPGDAPSAVFDVDVEVVETGAGVDFRGPFVHGRRRGERFIYLVWTHADTGGEAVMFRRAKLLLAPLAGLDLSAAVAGHGRAVGELSLTDACGGPVCASVAPPAIVWQIVG
jgi:hypothetical protein